ncbi:MAG: type II toxin-antitoxin system VapC family toxin [Parcubacteria group bacterium]
MNSLLDTNVVSEFMQARPDSTVIGRLKELDFSLTHLSVATIAEIRLGIERLPLGRRRAALEQWLVFELPLLFEDNLLPITEVVADRCGVIRARSLDAGRPISIADAFIAATADVHGLTLVTRNVRDFEVWGGPVYNPWADN